MVTRSISANNPTQVNTHTLGVEVNPSTVSITVDASYTTITSASTVDGKQLISTHDNDVYKYNGSTITAGGTTYYELDAYESGVTPAKLYNLYDEPLPSQTLFIATGTEVMQQGSPITNTYLRSITVNGFQMNYITNTETIGGVTYHLFSDGANSSYTISEAPVVGDTTYDLNESMTVEGQTTEGHYLSINVGGTDYTHYGGNLYIGGVDYMPYSYNNDLVYTTTSYSVGDPTYTYSGTVTSTSTVTSYESSTMSIVVDGETYGWTGQERYISVTYYYQWYCETSQAYVYTTHTPSQIAAGDTVYSITNESMTAGTTISSVTPANFTFDGNVYYYTGNSKLISVYTYYEYAYGDNKLYTTNYMYPGAGMDVYSYSASMTESAYSVSGIYYPVITVNGSDLYEGNDTFKTFSGVNYYEYVNSSDKLYVQSLNPQNGAYTYTLGISYTVTPYTTLGMPFSVTGTGRQVYTDKVVITNEYTFTGGYIINNDETAPFKIGLITSTSPVVTEQTLNKAAQSSWEGYVEWNNNDYNMWSVSDTLAVGDSLIFMPSHPEYNQQTVKSVTAGSISCTVSYSVTGDSFTQIGSTLTDKNNVICNIPKYCYLKFSQNVVITEE